MLELPLNIKKSGMALLGLVAITYLIYLPALHGYFLHTDDYFWSYWGGYSCKGTVEWILPIGRPLAGLVYCLFSLVKSFPLLNVIRFVAVLNIGIVAALVYLWFRRWKIPEVTAFFLSILTITLPAFQVFSSYISTLPHGLSVTTSLIALFFADAALNNPKKRKKFLMSSMGFLMIALSFNQTGGLYYCAGLAVPILLLPTEGFLKSFKRSVFPFFKPLFGGMALYYVIFRVSAALFHFRHVGKYDGRKFVTDFRGRYSWFFNGPLIEVSNLWSVEGNHTVYRFVSGLLIAFGLWILYQAIRKSTSGSIKNAVCKVLFLALLFPFSFGISLVSSGPSLEYRTYSALGSVQLWVLFIGCFTMVAQAKKAVLQNFWQISLVGFSLFAAFIANKNAVHFFVFPDAMEFRAIKKAMREHINTKGPVTHIHIILVKGPVASEEKHEMGEPTIRHTPNIPPLVLAALSELGQNSKPLITTANELDEKKGTALVFNYEKVEMENSQHDIDPTKTLIVDLSQFNYH